MCFLYGYRSSSYWLKYFCTTDTFKVFSATLGFFWLLTVSTSFISDAVKANLQSAWPLFIVFSVLFTLWNRRPLVKVSGRILSRDTYIDIVVADIFSLDTAYIISTNTTFDTLVNETLISKNSLQGAFTQRYYDNVAHLDTDIRRSLGAMPCVSQRHSYVNGNADVYPIGTVAKVSPKNKTVYLLAIATLNENGVAESNFESVKIALASIWNYISLRGSLEQLSIPVLGTGHGRIATKRSDVVMEIVRSFIAATSERTLTQRLTVVISPQDYAQYNIDIIELGSFLSHVCKYTEIRGATSAAQIGTAL